MDNDKLYDLIDQDDSLTDEEKRQAYFSELDYSGDEFWGDE